MNKVIFITGSTDGIGKLAASKLADAGHTLILHGRNSEKLSKVIQEIKSDTNNKNVSGYVADFSDLEAVRKMAKLLKSEVQKIDVLINNAGIFQTSTPRTQDGLDVRMVVNYLAPYILTEVLIPILKNSPEPRVINLSSAAQSTISPDVLKGKTQVSAQSAYAQSKLAILMWSFYLSTQHPDISVFALNPGSLLNTNMVREAYGRFWSSADKGADIIVDLALSDTYTGKTGQYFDNDQGAFNRAHEAAYDPAGIDNLIDMTNSILRDYNKK